MALVANSEVWAPFWCKPFGEQSEAREQRIVAPLLADRTREINPRNVVSLRGLLSTSKKGSGRPYQPASSPYTHRQPLVKIKAYAHDRVVLMSYLEAPQYAGKSLSREKLRREVLGTSTLVKPHEFRRHFVMPTGLAFQPAPTRFTSYARNMVRDAAHIVEQYESGKGVFVTLTFPGGTADGYRTLAAASGFIVDRLNRWLRYKLEGGIFTYVWELQKRGAGHLHYLFRLPRGVTNAKFSRALRAQWRKILLEVSKSSGVDLFARLDGGTWKDDPLKPRCQVKTIKRTYVQYIAKYISKSRSKDGGISCWCPRRWWGCSKEARRLVREARFEQTFPVGSCEIGIEGITSVLLNLGDTVLGAKWFSHIPGYPPDSVSIALPPGRGREIALAISEYFSDGDLMPLSIALIDAEEHFRQRKRSEEA